ncbi:MAG: hypothetical protein WC787_00595 [Patescibacteria group bacterium]|jgi:hypothetical protein
MNEPYRQRSLHTDEKENLWKELKRVRRLQAKAVNASYRWKRQAMKAEPYRRTVLLMSKVLIISGFVIGGGFAVNQLPASTAADPAASQGGAPDYSDASAAANMDLIWIDLLDEPHTNEMMCRNVTSFTLPMRPDEDPSLRQLQCLKSEGRIVYWPTSPPQLPWRSTPLHIHACFISR